MNNITPEPGREAKEAFMRIHYAKIRLNKDEGDCEIIDNFNKVSFSTTLAKHDSNSLTVHDLEGDTVFTITKTGHAEFLIRSPWAEVLGEVLIEEKERPEGPVSAEIFTKDRTVRLQASRMPLIHKSNEFQVTLPKTGDVVGRINVVRSKAVISMQPELEALYRVRIIGTAIILLEIYNNFW